MKTAEQQAFEESLVDDIGKFYDDPLGYVLYAFPWGVPGTELEDFDGPDEWQRDQLNYIGKRFREDPEATIRDATSSGHGIGKTTETSWLILWAMSTRPHLRGVVTANTMKQLATKTWPELSLWHKRAINEHWFKWNATTFHHKDHPSTWFVAAIPNTEHNSEAFAGLHAKHVLVIFDEASGIPDKIWEVTEGAMTTPRAMWFVYGNPTKNTGRFVQCFTTDKARWRCRKVDSRTCKMTNKAELEEWVEHYGEDSDFVRIRIRGEFPRSGSMQFIASDRVDHARIREHELEVFMLMPKVIGVDVARYGDDQSVITIRQGRKLLEQIKFREYNTMDLAVQVALQMKKHRPQATFVDGVGVGAGVVDRLRQLGYDIIEVNAGHSPLDEETYYNKRAEMWGKMKIWLETADIPDDGDLRESLIGIEYTFDEKERIRLERKKDMKKRGLKSPDEGDSLAMTFAEDLGDIATNAFEPNDESFEPA